MQHAIKQSQLTFLFFLDCACPGVVPHAKLIEDDQEEEGCREGALVAGADVRVCGAGVCKGAHMLHGREDETKRTEWISTSYLVVNQTPRVSRCYLSF